LKNQPRVDKQAAPELINLLNNFAGYETQRFYDPDESWRERDQRFSFVRVVRAGAATALGQLDDKQAAPELVTLLHDQDPAVRTAAAITIGELGDKQPRRLKPSLLERSSLTPPALTVAREITSWRSHPTATPNRSRVPHLHRRAWSLGRLAGPMPN
jgi:hypothetical protein